VLLVILPRPFTPSGAANGIRSGPLTPTQGNRALHTRGASRELDALDIRRRGQPYGQLSRRLAVQRLDRGEQFGQRAPEPIEADHRQRVALAGIGDQLGQTGPLHALARHDVGEHLDGAGLLQAHCLSRHVLITGVDAGLAVIGDPPVPAVLAGFDVTAQCSGVAVLDGRHHP
jgi:hypothetical protein